MVAVLWVTVLPSYGQLVKFEVLYKVLLCSASFLFLTSGYFLPSSHIALRLDTKVMIPAHSLPSLQNLDELRQRSQKYGDQSVSLPVHFSPALRMNLD